MTEAPEREFVATHTLNGVPVKGNPNWKWKDGPATRWIDAEGNVYRAGIGFKAVPIGPSGIWASREAVATALRASCWPDSSAPCGHAGNSNDDDATFLRIDENDNCIVNLFIRGQGYFKVKIPPEMYLEIADE